jgi:membrane protease YdiL (CAAX protease family)
VLISKRFGSGRLAHDFGWRFQVGDLLRGLLVFVVAVVAGNLATAALRQSDTAHRTSDAFRYGFSRLPAPAIVELAIAAVLAAPLLEELAFRGILLRTFTTRLGVWPAVVLQAVLFGAYHFNPDLGVANVPYTISLAVTGLVFGFAAMRWKRLGAGVVAHVIANVIFVVTVVATR